MKPVLLLVGILSLFLMGMSQNSAWAQVNLPEPVVNPPAVFPLPSPNVLYLHSVYQDRWVRMFFGNLHYAATRLVRLSPLFLAKCDSVDFFIRVAIRGNVSVQDTIFFWADTTISGRRQPGTLLGYRAVAAPLAGIGAGVLWVRAKFSTPQPLPAGDFWIGYVSVNVTGSTGNIDSLRVCVDTTVSADTTRNVVQMGNRTPGNWIMPIPSRCDWALTAFISPQLVQVEQGSAARGADFISSLKIQPNPFSTHTSITCHFTGTEPVKLVLYDRSGKAVRTLVSQGESWTGHYRVVLDARDENGRRLASGVYFIALEAGKQRIVHRLVLRE